MTVVGFHASHEQIDPRTLLADLRRAEEVGFDAGMCSDHFAPWSERQGESGFAWSWGQRYHPATAAWAAHWADGLATINQPPETVREVLDAYRRAGGRGPAVLQLHLSLAPTYDEALAIAHDQWRTNVFEPDLMWDLESPARFDAIGEHVSPETVAESVLVDHDPARLAERIADLVRLGFDQVMLHHVGQDQGHFLTQSGETLLPRLREALG
jgi:alkanesulfonate monooxygenase SsuD/methylene tetrahydromethanopterin reductase-like flavin-dependent oxidoreductase (luciferase family)